MSSSRPRSSIPDRLLNRPRPRRGGVVSILFALAWVAGSPIAHSDDILPFKEVRVGMKGEGRSVFQGTRISRFDAEVIGVMENIAPRRNLILVRLSGDPVDKTGVLEGMSGSPVYVGGRVIGAVAYSWAFSKEAIAGVTPIEEMLDAQRKGGGSPGRSRSAPPLAGASPLSALFDPPRILEHFDRYFSTSGAGPEAVAAMRPLPLPLSFTGFPAGLLERLTSDLRSGGFVPMQVGSAGKGSAEDPLAPGSAMAVKLVKGDVEISAVGTVTYRDGDRILAFGHPLFNLGPISLPLAAAEVHTLLPSLEASFKIASPASEEVGSIQQDRSVGISGLLSAPARMIPIRVEMSDPASTKPQRFAFDVMEDSFVTPYLIYASLLAVFSSAEKDYGDATVKLLEGSVMKVDGENDVELANLFSGDLAQFYAAGTVAYISQLILNNEYHPARVNGINLMVQYADQRRTARVERVWCGRERVRPGEKVSLTVSLEPYQNREITRTFELTIPEELPPGRLTLQVGDGRTVSRKEEQGAADFHPRDLSQLIWLINHIRTNDRLYVVLTRPDNGILFQGARMPDLPPSKALVMLRPQTEGNYLRVDFRGIAEDSLTTDFDIDGYKTLTLEVEEQQ